MSSTQEERKLSQCIDITETRNHGKLEKGRRFIGTWLGQMRVKVKVVADSILK